MIQIILSSWNNLCPYSPSSFIHYKSWQRAIAKSHAARSAHRWLPRRMRFTLRAYMPFPTSQRRRPAVWWHYLEWKRYILCGTHLSLTFTLILIWKNEIYILICAYMYTEMHLFLYICVNPIIINARSTHPIYSIAMRYNFILILFDFK